MAARIARNRSELLQAARNQGTPIVVLSGEAEAALSLLAVVLDPKFAEADRVTVVDIGGHSTEVSTARRAASSRFGWALERSVSLPVGTLALIADSLAAECPNPGEILRASDEIDRGLSGILSDVRAGVVVTVGATGTNLVTVREGIADWDPALVHGARLDFDEVALAVERLSGLTLRERELLVGMEPGRERTLHAGALILERAMHALHVEGAFVSVRGWRHTWIELDYPDSVSW
jgi:exopolyphosphatase/guanosine-5'-triphosphate,3'-diphosphate pyrophosphatase